MKVHYTIAQYEYSKLSEEERFYGTLNKCEFVDRPGPVQGTIQPVPRATLLAVHTLCCFP
jgi:hypothetical protein